MKLYYIDVDIKSSFDKKSIISEIFQFLHLNEHILGKFALDFPQYKESEKKFTEKENEKYASFGSVIRIFSEQPLSLQNLIDNILLNVLIKKKIITVSTIKETPQVKMSVSYTRDLTFIHINKLLKKIKKKDFSIIENEDFLKEKIKKLQDYHDENLGKNFYFKISSNSNKNCFMFFVKRNISTNNLTNFNPTSYGLSDKNNIVWLPLF